MSEYAWISSSAHAVSSTASARPPTASAPAMTRIGRSRLPGASGAPGPQDAAVGGPRQAVSASEHRQRRERVEPAGAGAQAVARAVDAAIHPALQAALQVDQRAPPVERAGHGIE